MALRKSEHSYVFLKTSGWDRKKLGGESFRGNNYLWRTNAHFFPGVVTF